MAGMGERPVTIYALVDPRTNQIRYIGKAINPGQRLAAHLARCRFERTHKGAWIRQLRKEGLLPLLRLLELTNEQQWADREKWWIAFHRVTGTPLVNGADGGEGNPGRTASPETRKRMSASMKAAYARSPEIAEAAALRSRARWSDPAMRERITAAIRIALADPDRKAARVEQTKRMWARPGFTEKMAAKMKIRWADPGYRERCTKARAEAVARNPIRERWRDRDYKPEFRAAMAEQGRVRLSTPESRQIIRERMLKRFTDPSERQKQSERTKAHFAKEGAKEAHAARRKDMYTPEVRARMSAAAKARWADPGKRAAVLASRSRSTIG